MEDKKAYCIAISSVILLIIGVVIARITLKLTETFFLICGADVAAIVAIFAFVIIRRKFNSRRELLVKQLNSDGRELRIEYSFLRKVAGIPTRFRLKELEEATDNFGSLVGRGSSACVFKGILSDGAAVAVKRIEGEERGEKEFKSEVAAIASVQHVNLVRLLGYCSVPPSGPRFLVYEYVVNGSLDNWLFPRRKIRDRPSGCLLEVDLPTENLAGIRFEFTAGSLTIRCRDFTGDIVLSRPAGEGSSQSQAAISSPSKKRTIDLSASDDDEEETDAKRLRPNFLNEVEQTLLLAQLNGSDQKPKDKEKKPKTQQGDGAVEVASATEEQPVVDSEEVVENAGGKSGKKTPTKKSKKKANSAKEGVDSFFSPEPKQTTSRKATPDSNKKRSKTLKSRADPSAGKSIKELVCGLPKPKSAATVKWGMVEPLGDSPPERWGHTATKISEERVVLYGGTDDDERTLGDLHVFDMKTHRWTTPLNCETITRTWHDAVYLSSKNLVLVFGGERNLDVKGELDILSDIMVLDTECFLWYPPAIRGSPPSARSGHTCTAVGNEVVVFGGSGGRNRQSSVHILDSNDWNWKAVKVEGKPPSARTYHSAVAVGDDKIVYFGGNDSSKSFNAVHVLHKVEKKANEAVWTWFHPSVVGVPPQERTGHSATLLNDGKILIFGGWDPQRDDANAPTSVFNDAFLLDTKNWEWQPATFTDEDGTGGQSRGRVGHGAVLDSSGCVHLYGGQNGAEQRLKDICTMEISQKLDDQPKEKKPGAATASSLETDTVSE